MSNRSLALTAAVVWVLAVLLVLSAGRGETLERCPDGHPRPIGSCHE